MVPGNFDVVVTTYEMVKSTKFSLARFSWYCLVIDEAHRIKSDKTQIAEGTSYFIYAVCYC